MPDIFQNSGKPMTKKTADEHACPTISEGPSGLGGWLLLPILHLLLVFLHNGMQIIRIFLRWDVLLHIFELSSTVPWSTRSLLLFAILVRISFFCLAMAGFFALLFRSPIAPKLVFSFYVVSTVSSFLWLGTWLFTRYQIDSNFVNSIGTIIAAILGSAYFRRSVRVADTFKTQDIKLKRAIDGVF